jgi:hypothetical protein
MILFLFIFFLLIGGFVLILVSSSTKEIADNWPKYRCSPTVMPFASLYGKDVGENFEFCLKNIFQTQSQELLGPFGGIIMNFIGTLSTMIESANSMRLQMATLVGGVTTITKEFQDRITQVMFRTQLTGQRMKMLMGRLFATFNAIIYMGISGITAVTNFGDTFLFKFLDTFCFPPETPVYLEGKAEPVPISTLKIGDVLKGKHRVTAVFSFYSNGQEMVQFPDGTQVSTNHFVLSGTKWLKAKYHPQATPVAPWAGGLERPLICVNTSDHQFQVGEQTFRDYDETDEGDEETMRSVEYQVNNASSAASPQHYSPSVAADTLLQLKTGTKAASQIKLGDALPTGTVVGLIRKEVTRICKMPTGDMVAEGTLCWDTVQQKWIRAAYLAEVKILDVPVVYYSFVVAPTATIQLASGLTVRDYVEILSPDTESAYAQLLYEENTEER